MYHHELLLVVLQTAFVYAFRDHLSPEESIREDMTLDSVEFIRKYGNRAEKHDVTTADGYVLGMHRMLPQAGTPARHFPVFIMHGLASSSFDWLTLGPRKSLPHLLSAAGFDVWLGNARGNLYSKKHIKLQPTIHKFWNFSWHEIGSYDVPASIDYVLNSTGNKILHYVGHSQGTTSFFVMCSMRPEYNQKIKTMNALAPVAFMSKAQTPGRLIAKYSDWANAAVQLTGYEVPNVAQDDFGYKACNEKSAISELCDNMFFLLGGYNSILWNKTLVPLMMSHAPAGFSMKQLIHYGQEIVSGKFRQFDYGLKNMAVYGGLYPPDYRLGLVSAPVALHWADGDPLAHPHDVRQLSSKLRNVVLDRWVPFHNFSHLDFLWAIDAKKYLYDAVIEVIMKGE